MSESSESISSADEEQLGSEELAALEREANEDVDALRARMRAAEAAYEQENDGNSDESETDSAGSDGSSGDDESDSYGSDESDGSDASGSATGSADSGSSGSDDGKEPVKKRKKGE